MVMALTGLSALVTGGGSGIGLACALALAGDGCTVTIAGRSSDRLEKAAAGTDLRTIACDVAVEADVEAAVAAAAEPTGKLDIAVLAAGKPYVGSFADITLDDWNDILGVNLTGSFLCIKHAAPRMTEGGSIVAISSIAGSATHRLMAPYAVSKSAIDALVRNAADELGASGIRVNAVRPSLVPTDMTELVFDMTGIVNDYLAQMPLGRLGTVEDVAAAVRYFAGPESAWVTGQCIGVDGGHSLRRGPDLLAPPPG
jgi:NAD(P)-dependent dehydrogenase (short-subunit alcohol dehydrogenase family)